jgi:hypothetical protein
MTSGPAILLLAIELLASSSALASRGAGSFRVARQRRTSRGVSVDVAFGKRTDHEWPVDLYLVKSTSATLRFLKRVRGHVGDLVKVALPYRRLGIQPGSAGYIHGVWRHGRGSGHVWGGREGSFKPSGTIDFPALRGRAGRRSR